MFAIFQFGPRTCYSESNAESGFGPTGHGLLQDQRANIDFFQVFGKSVVKGPGCNPTPRARVQAAGTGSLANPDVRSPIGRTQRVPRSDGPTTASHQAKRRGRRGWTASILSISTLFWLAMTSRAPIPVRTMAIACPGIGTWRALSRVRGLTRRLAT